MNDEDVIAHLLHHHQCERHVISMLRKSVLESQVS